MVTSHDVARLAGVSQPTVSRALRDSSRVSAQTRERVRSAAKALGYVPSEAGRTLSSGRTYRIGLLLTDLENQFYPHIIAPVHRELETHGYQLVLHTEAADTDTVVGRLVANGLDGVLLATTTTTSVIPVRLRDRGVPFVYFNRTSDMVTASSAVVDPAPGMRQAADVVARLGHRRVAAVFGPATTSTGLQRETALREALLLHGLTVSRRYGRHGPYDEEGGHRAVTALLAQDEPPTVVFCGNDVVAIGALNAAKELGLSVPDDLSVIGFDDLPLASWPVFDLSTVAYDIDAMARRAARLLVGCIEDPDGPVSQEVFSSRFVDRRTLAPPR